MFSSWDIPNPDYAEEEPKVPVTVRQYTKKDISTKAVSEVLELITKICELSSEKEANEDGNVSPQDSIWREYCIDCTGIIAINF